MCWCVSQHEVTRDGLTHRQAEGNERMLCILLLLLLWQFGRGHRLVGLVVKASASRAEDPGFESRLRRDFFGVESYQ